MGREVEYAAERLGEAGITLCLEAINSRVDMPGFLLDTSARVMQVIESVEADNVRLQYDLYHMQIVEGDLIRTMECLLPWIGHVQVADNPGRRNRRESGLVPGQGLTVVNGDTLLQDRNWPPFGHTRTLAIDANRDQEVYR